MSPPSRQNRADAARTVRKRRRRRADRAKRRKRVGAVFGVLVIGAAIALVAGTFTAAGLVRSRCDLTSLKRIPIGQNSFVYAADGTPLGSIPAERNRQPVTLAEINPWMRKATIAIEDRRFYSHGGVDYEGIARALWHDVTKGKVVEGGSTLTQQLVRNLYISREQTVSRKLREACLAIQLSRKWPKHRILREWMNTVYFGNHAYGIEAAAQTYFSKHAKSLNLREAVAARGPAAGAVDLRPLRRSRRSDRASRRGSAGDAVERGHHAASVQLGDPAERARPQPRQALHDDPRAVLLRLRARPADRAVRGEHRSLRGASGLHDDQPALSADRGSCDPAHARPGQRPGVRGRLDQSGERSDPGNGRRRPRDGRASSSTWSRRRVARRARRSRCSSSRPPSREASTRPRRTMSPRPGTTSPTRTSPHGT